MQNEMLYARHAAQQPGVIKGAEVVATKPAELFGIQMLRGLAALAVVVHHTLEESNGATGRFSPDWLTVAGAAGVDVFFAISGFIMLYTSFRPNRPPMAPRDFLVRRFARIYPFYWVCCFAVLAIIAAGFLDGKALSLGSIIASFTLAPGSDLIGISWTLVYEVYFYLVFAVALSMASVSKSLTVTTLAIMAILAASTVLPKGVLESFLSNPLPLEFCAGMGVAYVFMRRDQRPIVREAIVWGIVILSVVAIASAPLFIAHPSTAGLPAWPRIVVWGIPAVALVIAFLHIGTPSGLLSNGLVFLGDASYSLYLTHIFVLMGYGLGLRIPIVSSAPQAMIVPVIIFLCMAVGCLAYVLIERPLTVAIRQAMRTAVPSAA